MSYSPHREAGGTLHLPSPTLAHKYSIESFDSISKLRKSLSRSPSRPQRFQLFTTTTPHRSPGSPLSPFKATQNLSPTLSQNSDEGNAPVSPLEAHHQASVSRKGKYPLRRAAPFRSSPRNRSTPGSPMRRALSDTTNQGNSLPPQPRSMQADNSSDENIDQKENVANTEGKAHHFRMSLNDGPIKFEFGRSMPDANVPAKSSPLKRSDGVMNLERDGFSSPVAKRRSLHGAPTGSDMESLRLMFAGDGACDGADETGKDNVDRPIFGSPYAARDSPLRKTASLRKSTLQQRHTPGQQRTQPSEFAVPGLAASKARHRFSLDGSTTFNSPVPESPLRRSLPGQSAPLFSQHQAIPHRPSPASKQPHPLATALSPSSSASSLCEDSQQSTVPPLREFVPSTTIKPTNFSKSLPVGTARPPLLRSNGGTFVNNQSAGQGVTFATPDGYKFARPLPAAFMSTGLISKKNRNADLPAGEAAVSYAMPDTPSKRASFPPDTTSPFRRSTISVPGGVTHEFASPSTPFSAHARQLSTETFGQSITAFNMRIKPTLTRRESFVSMDGDDLNQSPNMIESQSSNDEFPPTPTKPTGEGRRSKENSLRSSMFGRGENRRTSINQDTFLPPAASDVASAPMARRSESPPDLPLETAILYLNVPMTDATLLRTATPTGNRNSSSQTSPHTPQDSFHPPDPSGLSISGQGAIVNPFKLSTASNSNLPPATPTSARDYNFPFGNPRQIQVAGVTKNDVDTSLTARFGTVSLYGHGEFSQVYRVEDMVNGSFNAETPFSSFGKAWAVKKTRRPYAGLRERERKQMEVKILKALRGNEHVVNFVDSWEEKGHLYIQTDFCENGNLKDFLTNTGFKGRLDDFRIWKIMLELSMVSATVAQPCSITDCRIGNQAHP